MIDFKAELAKYKPIMEVDEIEAAMKNDEMRDLLDILEMSSKKGVGSK